MIHQIPPVASIGTGGSGVSAQWSVTGGTPVTALLAILVFFIAIILSVLVTYKYAQGYFATRQRPVLYLAVGMLLLAPVPMFIQLLVGNITVLTEAERRFIVTLSKLCGLLLILGVVHQK